MLQVNYSNNIRVSGYSVAFKCHIADELTIPNPAYEKAKRQRRPTWGIDQKLKLYVTDHDGTLIVPRGYRKQLHKHINDYSIPYKDSEEYTNSYPVDFGWNNDYMLRDYQAPAVDALTKANGVLEAPAGSGKTIMGMKYISKMGLPTLWLTHTTDLMQQAKQKAEVTLPDVGKIGQLGDGKHDYGDRKLIIASVQTLRANPDIVEYLNTFVNVVVIDEAHHFPAVQFIETAAQLKAKYIVGLTATPDRKDGLQTYMYMGIGPLLHTVERDELYDNGELILPTVKFVYTQFSDDPASDRDDTNVDAGGDEVNYAELIGKLIKDEQRIQLVAESIVDALPQGPAIVLAESVRYCFKVQEAVKCLCMSRGLNPVTAVVHAGLQRNVWRVCSKDSAEVWNSTHGYEYRYNGKLHRWQVKLPQYTDKELTEWRVTPKERKQIIQAMKDGKIDILFATQLAREGLDIPLLCVGHCITPKKGDISDKKSGAALEQEIGRIMRPDPQNPDKKAIWYDYVDDNVGIFKQQYYTRRKVYKRLGITVPAKPKTERDIVDDFLNRQIF